MKQSQFILLLLLFLIGCHNKVDWDKERLDIANKHYLEILSRQIKPEKKYSLQECIDAGIKHNYDYAIFSLREKINKKKDEIAKWGLMPALNMSYSHTDRNKYNASNSQTYTTNRKGTEATISADKKENSSRSELYFSFIDFGLNYYISEQEKNKSKLTLLQKEKAKNALTFDIIRAYYTVASSQKAMKKTKELLEVSVIIEKNLETIADAKTISPLTILAEKKQILRLKQYLEEFKRVYENSCIELITLMGYAPSSNIRVDTKIFKDKSVKKVNIEKLVKKALLTRTELKEFDIKKDILSLESKKKFALLFPNVSLSAAFNSSSNSYLENSNWFDIGARASFNLFALPTKYKEYKKSFLDDEVLNAETIAMTVAIIAQVRIAYANLCEVRSRYELSNEIYRTHLKQLKLARSEIKIGGDLSEIEIFKMSMETANASIERVQQLANYKLAYYRLLNAVGIDFKLNK